MDLEKSISELLKEKERLDKAIAALETLVEEEKAAGIRRSPRGRKSMGDQERRQVSQRMRKYWRMRRASKKESQ